MKTIIKSLLIIFIMAVFVIGGTVAYFSDTEISTGNAFTAGTLNLKVGEDDPTTWKFDLPETIMPGDKGKEEAEIKNTGTIDGYLHISFANLLDDENENVEPEQETANQSEENCEEEGGVWNTGSDPDNICDLKGDASGELAENLEILIYIDGAGGIAGEFDLGIDELVYQGKARGILQGDIFNYSLASNGTIDFRVEWNLPIAVGNVAQSDKAGFDIIFELTQHKKEIVGDWSFDENSGIVAYDTSGWKNDGAINGAVFKDGEYNPALKFDGINDYVNCGNDSSLDLSEEWTIAMWVKWQANSETYQTIFNKENGNIAYSAWIYSDELYFGMSSGGTWHQDSAMGDIPEDIWTYVVVTFDGIDADAYINGGYTDTLTVGRVGDINDANLYLGIRKANKEKFKGRMNEVKIYSRALSADEILENYNKSENSGETDTVETKTIYLNQFGVDINGQYGYNHDYTNAANNNVAFTYDTPQSGGKLTGTMSASGLKPYATYQVKFEGKPICNGGGNDQANEYIGYKGRWTCVDCSGSAAQRNRSDAQYQANSYHRGNSSECIVGYLVFDYFTADASGDIEISDINILTDTSYHVLYCGGGVCGAVNNGDLYYPDSSHPSLAFCPADKVDGKIEPGRGGCNGLSLDSGNYDLKMILTEESFHQGSWATVLMGDINFEIE